MGHAIFYGMTELPQIEERHLHGEVVSYGVLCMLMMDGQMELLDEIYKFNYEEHIDELMDTINSLENEENHSNPARMFSIELCKLE